MLCFGGTNAYLIDVVFCRHKYVLLKGGFAALEQSTSRIHRINLGALADYINTFGFTAFFDPPRHDSATVIRSGKFPWKTVLNQQLCIHGGSICEKKIHFLLSSMSVVYVLTTLIPEYGDDATVEQLRKRPKFDNDDYDSVEAKYMAEDASSKKFLVSNFTNYKMTDSSHLRIEESLRVQDSDKPKRNNVAGPSVVNMVEHNNFTRHKGLSGWITYSLKGSNMSLINLFQLNIGNDNIGSAFMSTSKLNDLILWHARLGHIHFKRMQDMSNDGLIPAFDIDIEKFMIVTTIGYVSTAGKV
ncbi:zinc finger, CCHC-type containing protein [Tanacetum coccineum]